MITELGHVLGTSIIAEGVETADQYQLLHRLGCDRAQGFLMSRPLTTEALHERSRQQAPPDEATPAPTDGPAADGAPVGPPPAAPGNRPR